MLKNKFLYAVIILIVPLPLWSQYSGGIGRGEVVTNSSVNQLNGAMLAIYGGGNGRGETISSFKSNQLDGAMPAIYGGGNGRGEVTTVMKTNQLDGNVLNIFGGGNGRGEVTTVTKTNQLDGSVLNIYGGGNGRGEFLAFMKTNQLDGGMPGMFGGGDGRGETIKGVYTLQLDGQVENSMYLGGNGRGETVQRTTSISLALPVKLLSFSAAAAGSQVKVQWQTATELNSAFFIVEKSPDGSSWQSIGTVQAAGHSDLPLSYQLYDAHPAEGVNYYRLKPTDLDGQFTYSGVALVRFHTGNAAMIMVYPNPVAYQFTVALQNAPASTRLHISLVNAQGQTVLNKQQLNGNTHTFNISQLAAGVYYLVIDNNGELTTTKILKQ